MESITIKDIAKICGVGVSTVSRAINNHPDINPETKQQVLDIIKEHNYIPNNSARNLKRVDAKAIAILVKGITNPFFSKMIKIMEREIQRQKYSLILHHVDDEEDEVEIALQLIKEKRLRGIIFLGGYFSHTEFELRQITVPFVLSTIGAMENIPEEIYSSVSVDDFAESYKITKFLLELGHTKIAHVTANKDDQSIGYLRLQGYRMAIQDAGLKVDQDLIVYMDESLEAYSIENGYEVTKRFLRREKEFTAVYAISDQLAIGTIRALVDAGYRVPEDVSVAGFDGIELGKYYCPSLTTLKQPVEDIAKESIQMLFEEIEDQKNRRHKIFHGELILGESTKQLS